MSAKAMRTMVYLNHALTWPLDPRVGERMAALLQENPDHPDGLLTGRRLDAVLEESRREVALLIGAAPDDLTFTSGGTEACNLALKGVVLSRLASGRGAGRIVVGATERTAVTYPARTLAKLGAEVVEAPAGPDGVVDPDRLAPLLEGAALVSIGVADEETGTRQPLREIGEMARARGALVHVDASVAAGYLPLSVSALGVDLMSLSAHRLGGPRGAGALFVRRGVRVQPLIEGGTQEGGRRGGMPDAAGLAGFGLAASIRRAALPVDGPGMESLGRGLAESLASRAGARLNGHPEARIHALVNVSLDGVDGEAVILKLARLGVMASTGSACAQEAGKPSPVLLAMGLSETRARSSVLFSLGPSTTAAQLDRACTALDEALARLRALAPRTA